MHMYHNASEVKAFRQSTWVESIYLRLRGKRDAKYRDTLVALSLFANKHGRCFPSIKELAAMCGLTYEGMRRRLQKLVELGLISRIARFEKNGRQTSNGYVVLPDTPGTIVRGLKERTEESSDNSASPEPISPPGTPGDAPSSTSPPATPSPKAGQGGIWHMADTWRWWFPRVEVVPVEGEPRPVGTVVSVVENARETYGSSFLAHLFGAEEDDLPDGEVA